MLQIGGPGTGGESSHGRDTGRRADEGSALGNAGRNHKCTPSGESGLFATSGQGRVSCSRMHYVWRKVKHTVFSNESLYKFQLTV